MPILYLKVDCIKSYIEWYKTFNEIKIIVQYERYALIKYKNKAYIYLVEYKE